MLSISTTNLDDLALPVVKKLHKVFENNFNVVPLASGNSFGRVTPEIRLAE
jgi:hypothetical protein